MKTALLLLYALSLSIIGHSQEEISTDPYYFDSRSYEYSEFPKVAYVFADACKLRSQPTSGSETVAKLLIGDKVKILDASEKDTIINGVQFKWMHVESGKQKGYVWGGLLTNQVLKVSDSTSAVWGISRIVKVDEDQIRYYASVRIFSKKQIVKQLEFEVTYGDDPANGQLVMIKNPLLEGVEHIFVYNTLADACGVTWCEHYLLETAAGLTYFDAGYGMGEAALFYSSSTFIFPTKEKDNDYSINYFRKPEKDQVFKVTSHDEYDESCVWTENTRIETFEWKEGKLVPFCRQ